MAVDWFEAVKRVAAGLLAILVPVPTIVLLPVFCGAYPTTILCKGDTITVLIFLLFQFIMGNIYLAGYCFGEGIWLWARKAAQKSLSALPVLPGVIRFPVKLVRNYLLFLGFSSVFFRAMEWVASSKLSAYWVDDGQLSIFLLPYVVYFTLLCYLLGAKLFARSLYWGKLVAAPMENRAPILVELVKILFIAVAGQLLSLVFTILVFLHFT